MKLLIHSLVSTVAPLKFRNVWIIHFTLYNGCDYLSMLVLKLIHVSKRGYWMTGGKSTDALSPRSSEKGQNEGIIVGINFLPHSSHLFCTYMHGTHMCMPRGVATRSLTAYRLLWIKTKLAFPKCDKLNASHVWLPLIIAGENSIWNAYIEM